MKFIIFVFLLCPLFAMAKGFGVVTMVRGKAIQISENGQKSELKKGDKVFETDTITTFATSAVRIVMMDTNIIDIYPNSNLLIKEYVYDPKQDKKNVRLEITVGRVKSTVKQRYDNNRNKYEVKTPVVVAGVRGTVFITEHESESALSRIQTLEGHVMVGRLDAQEQIKEMFSVKANQKIQMDRQTESPQVQDIPKAELDLQKESDKKDGFTQLISKVADSNQETRKPQSVENSKRLPSSVSGSPTLNESEIVNSNPERAGASKGISNRVLESTKNISSEKSNGNSNYGTQPASSSGGGYFSGSDGGSPTVGGHTPTYSESPIAREPTTTPVVQPTNPVPGSPYNGGY